MPPACSACILHVLNVRLLLPLLLHLLLLHLHLLHLHLLQL